jgi:hypothetical protein
MFGRLETAVGARAGIEGDVLITSTGSWAGAIAEPFGVGLLRCRRPGYGTGQAG